MNKRAVELGKKYLAEHDPEMKFFINGDRVPFLAIKSNRPNADYFEPDFSSIYEQVYNYFLNNDTQATKQKAFELAGIFRDKAEQLKAAAKTLDKPEQIQAVIDGCLSYIRRL